MTQGVSSSTARSLPIGSLPEPSWPDMTQDGVAKVTLGGVLHLRFEIGEHVTAMMPKGAEKFTLYATAACARRVLGFAEATEAVSIPKTGSERNVVFNFCRFQIFFDAFPGDYAKIIVYVPMTEVREYLDAVARGVI